jgi:hypothetical protein
MVDPHRIKVLLELDDADPAVDSKLHVLISECWEFLRSYCGDVDTESGNFDTLVTKMVREAFVRLGSEGLVMKQYGNIHEAYENKCFSGDIMSMLSSYRRLKTPSENSRKRRG